MAKLYTLELGFVHFKSQTDLTDLYPNKRLAFFDRIIEIDAAKVRTYESYMISFAILILGHCESRYCHLHYNVLHTRNKRHKPWAPAGIFPEGGGAKPRGLAKNGQFNVSC